MNLSDLEKISVKQSTIPIDCDEKILGWIPVIYSNKNLNFFEAAATWIVEKQGKVFPLVQLRKAFKKKSSWLGYKKSEVLAHECVHALRYACKDSIYEEFIAYQTSKSFFRKYMGPIFQNTKESYLFLSLCLLPIFSSYGWIAFIGINVFFLLRLAIRTIRFKKALNNCAGNIQKIIFLDDNMINQPTKT